MKAYMLAGIILIAIGIIAFAYQGITYTTREKVVDIGPIQMTTEKTKTLPLPPIVGGIALVGGIVLLVMGNKKGWEEALQRKQDEAGGKLHALKTAGDEAWGDLKTEAEKAWTEVKAAFHDAISTFK
jgi:hypothetical protein